LAPFGLTYLKMNFSSFQNEQTSLMKGCKGKPIWL